MFQAAPKSEPSKPIPVRPKSPVGVPGTTKPVPGSVGTVGQEKDQSQNKDQWKDKDDGWKDKEAGWTDKDWKRADWKDATKTGWQPSQSSQASKPPQPRQAVPPARSEDVKKALTPVWKAINEFKVSTKSSIEELWQERRANSDDLRHVLKKQPEVNRDVSSSLGDINTRIRSGMDAVQQLRNSNMLTVDELKLSDSVINQIKQDISAERAAGTVLEGLVKKAVDDIKNHAETL